MSADKKQQQKEEKPAATPSTATAKPRRMGYARPMKPFLPIVLAFIMLNYLVASTETDASGRHRILPEYVEQMAQELVYARRQAEASGTAAPAAPVALYFEETIMGFVFNLGLLIFRSFQAVQALLIVTWIVHCYELGVCVKICRQCNTGPVATARFLFCTAVSGFAQLGLMLKARDAFLATADANGSGGGGGAADSKKEQ